MRSLNAIEKSALVLAGLLIIGGGLSAVRPVELTYVPASNSRVPLNIRSRPVHISKEGARVWGCIGVALGLGLGYVAFYRAHK